MNTKLILSIAKSLLLARWRQTLVAAIGVTFSIAMFITLLSFMTGLNAMLDGLIVNRLPHVRLYNEVKPRVQQPINTSVEYKQYYNFVRSVKATNIRQELYNSGAIIQAVQKDDRILGLAPRLTTQVFFNEGTIDVTGMINGIDVEAESQLFHFSDYMVGGDAQDLKTVSSSIVLGKPLAANLNVEIGDVVQITTANGERFPLRVVGYFQSGIQDFDKLQSYTSIATVQKLLGKPGNYITDINIKLKDIAEAPAVAKEYRQLFNTDAEDIQTANSQFETGNFIRTLISYTVGITLLIVAGFGIYNILNMMIYEKMDSIAILKATGFSGKDVKRIFLSIAISIGFFGGMVGLLLGFVLSVIIDQIPFITEALPTITTFPINYDPTFYFIGSSFSLITTYMAGWFPARKASKVDPVIIIRGK
ncbi:ABC transporter permease [Flavisolibacter tropicus]|uniref:ABC transporter n=1 Tax=Flavisolibacter tropicus TaxID=1492898 RepID=A0A172TT34_9BACT|nr:FtsX-like permease family protein [Flavisolibacter tropicus]ANE49943.1 ABC transporter [Flavisolibacter tropicus]